MSRFALPLLGALAGLGVVGACRNEAPRPHYVRDAGGRNLRWNVPSIVLEVRRPHSRVALTTQQLMSTLEQASAAWSVPGVPRVSVRAATQTGPSLEDAVNVVQFRHDRWCPFETNKPCYAKHEAALTMPYARPAAGYAEVLETDIELNAVDYRFDDGEAGLARLRLTLMHELGHVLGLGHVCGPASRFVASAEPCAAAHDASIMHPNVVAPDHSAPDRPSSADLAALQALYAR